MVHLLDVELAERFGVNAALAAQIVWDEVTVNETFARHQHRDRYWMLSSQKAFAAHMPYMTRHAVRRALETLMAHGVLERARHLECPFDNTWFYSFTPFGAALMEAREAAYA